MKRIGSDELKEQIAFERIDPLPDPYWIAAMIAHTTALWNWSGKGRRPRFDDFMPKLTTTSKSFPTAEESAANFKAFVTAMKAGRLL